MTRMPTCAMGWHACPCSAPARLVSCCRTAGSQPDKAFSETPPRPAVKMGLPRAYLSPYSCGDHRRRSRVSPVRDRALHRSCSAAQSEFEWLRTAYLGHTPKLSRLTWIQLIHSFQALAAVAGPLRGPV